MKNLSLSIYFFSIISIVSSCTFVNTDRSGSSGVRQEKVFEVSEFDEIEYGSAFEVEIKKGISFKVTANGDESDIADLSVEVIGGVLIINYGNGDLFSQISRGKMSLLIETPATLRSVNLGGASETKVSGFDSFDSFSMDISGASQFELNAAVKKLKIDISGASNVTLNQDLATLEGQISGASTLTANQKSVLAVVLDLSGASTADLNVEEKLDVEVSGASTVTYSGNPQVKEQTSGAGRVIKE